MIYNPFGVQCAHHSALWSWIVFDLPHGLSHLLSGEAGRTKGQSNVISSLVEPQALAVVIFSTVIVAKINDLYVYVCGHTFKGTVVS